MKRGFSLASEFSQWYSLRPVDGLGIDLDRVLNGGQVFHWRKLDGVWFGVQSGFAFRLRDGVQKEAFDYSFYQIACQDDKENIGLNSGSSHEQARNALMNFFMLDLDLESLSVEWSKSKIKVNMDRTSRSLRVTGQDPYECLISFIISANNNVSRITSIVQRLCQRFGNELVVTVPKDEANIQEGTGTVKLWTFPSPKQLAHLSESDYRDLGLGYRAGYIFDTIARLNAGATKLADLHERVCSLDAARASLLEFKGVGRKVADCVLLYSLGFLHIVPMDTHMKAVAEKHASRKGRAISHDDAQNILEEVFGKFSGVAQVFLFANALSTKSKCVSTSAMKRKSTDLV